MRWSFHSTIWQSKASYKIHSVLEKLDTKMVLTVANTKIYSRNTRYWAYLVNLHKIITAKLLTTEVSISTLQIHEQSQHQEG